MNNINTYYDFAKNDYDYLLRSYESGWVMNGMCANAQNVCEKFLKHLIDAYSDPKDTLDESKLERALRTHSLKVLQKYLKNEMGIEMTPETADIIMKADGYYFSARYPGDDSYFVDADDVKQAVEAAKECKTFVDNIIQARENHA